MPPELSVVVPFFNEAENVGPLIERVFEALRSQSGGLELLLVDDGSTDDTWVRIREAATRDPRVRPLRHPSNQGQSAALWTGFRASRGRVIATLDGDLQNDPADFPMMLAELAGCDLVCGVRTRRADNLLRRASTRVARWARRTALRVDFADTGCNLRVFKAELIHALPAFDGIHRFMPVLAHGAGAVVREVPVRHHPRIAGVSKYGVWNRLGRGIRDLIMVGLFLRRQLRLLDPDRLRHSAMPATTSSGAPEVRADKPLGK